MTLNLFARVPGNDHYSFSSYADALEGEKEVCVIQKWFFDARNRKTSPRSELQGSKQWLQKLDNGRNMLMDSTVTLCFCVEH